MKDRSRIPEEDITSYCLWLKEELKPHVGKVTISKRLRDTPCIISGQMSSSQRLAYQMMAQQSGSMPNDPQLEEASRQQTLELNPSHPLIVNLNQLRKKGNKSACSLVSRQLLDTVLTQTGIPYNFQEAVTRQYKLLGGYVELLVDNSETSERKIEAKRSGNVMDDVKKETQTNESGPEVIIEHKVTGNEGKH